MFKRLDFSRKFIAYLSALGIAAVLGACGGGGDPAGGGGEDPAGDGASVYPSITYTGVDSKAVIDQSNAADFPFVMLESSSSSGDIPLAISVDPQTTDGLPDVENIERASGLISGLIKNNLSNGANLITGVTQTFNGSCGGSVTFNESVTSSSFNGSMEFANYCEFDATGELTLEGLIIYDGNYYLDATNTPILTSLNLTIDYLKMTFTNGIDTISEEFSGSLVVTSFDPITNEPVDFTVTVNYVYEGKVYKVVNLVFDDISGDISGTLYHPDHGYVTITTTDPFEYYAPTDQYCGGSLQIVGSDGAVPVPGTVTIDFTADATCTYYDICIQVNTDPQNCATVVPWGTEPWPTAAVPAPTSPTPAP